MRPESTSTHGRSCSNKRADRFWALEPKMIRRVVLTTMFIGVLNACFSTPPPVALRSLSGPELYARLCASCHGAEGLGDGPVASLIEGGVPDLTRIAARADGGEFPAEDVHRIIDGRSDR